MPRNLSMPPESGPRTGPSLVATTGAPCFAPAAEAASTTAARARLRARPDELSLRMARDSDCVSLCEMRFREWLYCAQSLAEVAREMGGGGLGRDQPHRARHRGPETRHLREAARVRGPWAPGRASEQGRGFASASTERSVPGPVLED